MSLKVCMIEACARNDKGSIGAFYVRHHASLAGYLVDVLDAPRRGYDVEMISVHHCEDFERLAAMPKRARWRIVGGHPMQNNPRPVIPFADVICVGEGETWVERALPLLDKTQEVKALGGLPGTIVCGSWDPANSIPSANVENPLPDNPPYLNRPGTRSAAWYIEMARGCPYRCSFCELGHSTPYRCYDFGQVRRVIDEADTKKTRKINFYAPDEASHPNYHELYKYLEQRGFSAAFSSMRIESVLKKPPPIKSNHLIRVGIDGLTEATRRRVNKPITDQMIVDYFRMFLERGHVTFKMFMIIGYPWDTMNDFREWERMMRQVMALPLTKNVSLRIKWTPFIPQPCTPLREAKANYTWEMYQAVEKWHAMNRRPQKTIGWYVENDGLMSHRSHDKQCRLTCGDERILTRKMKS
jgi:radical SAM superfamily enzyme YgiQ (UPF0313 family)